MQYNDYELVCLAREGNEDAVNLIYQKYKPIIVKKSEEAIIRASHHGIEISDIMQEAYLGLDEAINAFREDDNASFYTFAMLCVNRQIINYLRKITGGRDKVLNDAVTIDDYLEKSIKDDFDTEVSFISQESERDIMEELINNLTNFEKEVLKAKIDGYSFEEIANTLNKDVKSIYNTFHRIKLKFKKIIDNDNYL
ncbi:MAG: sigma-70 family RNA polymerase sigma factor [Bacilli bacterium]|nr:sigma-70 family RNA polymerase sigma factor [Bacilli bacterium]